MAPPVDNLVLEQDPSFSTVKEWTTADVKGKAPHDIAAWLRQPKHVFTWYDALVALKQDVEAQMSAHKAGVLERQQECLAMGRAGKEKWFQFKWESQDWKRRANHYRTGIESMIREARAAKRSTPSPGLDVVVLKRMVVYLAEALCGQTGDDIDAVIEEAVKSCLPPRSFLSMKDALEFLEQKLKEETDV